MMRSQSLLSIDEIIIHHSGSKNSTPGSIRLYHKSLGWADCGYHYIVYMDGHGDCSISKNVYCMRPPYYVGAHCKGHNLNTLGICVCGDFSTAMFSTKLAHLLQALCKGLKLRHPSIKKVSFHNDYANTACPGTLVLLRDYLNLNL